MRRIIGMSLSRVALVSGLVAAAAAGGVLLINRFPDAATRKIEQPVIEPQQPSGSTLTDAKTAAMVLPAAQPKSPTMTLIDVCYASCDIAVDCGFAPSGEDIRAGCREGCAQRVPRDCVNEAEMVTAWQACSKACDQIEKCNPPACQHKGSPRSEQRRESAHSECVRRLIAHSVEQIHARGGEPDEKEVAKTADFTCGAAKDRWARALEIYRTLNAMAGGGR